MESGAASLDVMSPDAVSPDVVSLVSVLRVLALYAEALAGRPIPIRARGDRPADLAIDDGAGEKLDSSALYLPKAVDWFTGTASNFWFYKASILFQLAPFEAGTFEFSLRQLDRQVEQNKDRTSATEDRGWQLLGQGLAASRGVDAGAAPGVELRSHLEIFFARFARPGLAENLFTLFEGARFERDLHRRYAGLRAPLETLRRRALEHRPPLASLSPSLRPIEPWVRRALGDPPVGDDLAQQRPIDDVYASAIAVLDAYPSVDAASNRLSPTQPNDHGPREDRPHNAAREALRADRTMVAIPYHGPPRLGRLQRQVALRRAARDLLLDRDRDRDPTAEGRAPTHAPASAETDLDLDALREQLAEDEDSGLLGLLSLPQAPREGDAARSADTPPGGATMVGSSPGRHSTSKPSPVSGAQDSVADGVSTPSVHPPDTTDNSPEPDGAAGGFAKAMQDHLEPLTQRAVFRYDEWDWQLQGYRARWCAVHEIEIDCAKATDTAQGDFVHEVLARHATDLASIKKQLELLRPATLRRVRRLTDGEDVDLDRLIESHTDRRAGLPMSDDVYGRRQRQERDVAAAFLLDMSASTDSPIPEPGAPIAGADGEDEGKDDKPDDADRPVMNYDFVDILAGLEPDTGPHPRDSSSRPRRVIEIEKEALALMAEALETLGDRYAIYGFSGYGREQVDFFVAKEFDQAFDDLAKGRIGAISPKQSTRMGPAIRHAITKLENEEARNRVLLVLSDGYPQDCDYGEERGSPVYGIEDTTMALLEARRAGIQTFCITVDPAGHDYLRRMCPEESYLVIDDIAALSAELPKVYRGLTASR